MVRPVVEASFGAFLVLGATVNEVVGLAQGVMTDPAVVFSMDSIVNWGLMITGGTILWKASAMIRGLEASQKEAAIAVKEAARQAAANISDLERRISENERKWRYWEPTIIRMAERYGFELGDRHG